MSHRCSKLVKNTKYSWQSNYTLATSSILLLLLSGCSYHYIPRASTYPLDPIKEFSSNHSISLINSQYMFTDQIFAKRRSRTYYANYQAWTNTAIEITQRELQNRNMTVVDNTEKTLSLSIESITGNFRHWTMGIDIVLKVKTSDGLVKKYTASNRSGGGLKRVSDGAIMRVVAKMLRDQEIVAYLKK